MAAYESDWRKLAAWSQRVNGEPFDLVRMVGREAVEFRNRCLRLGQAPATVNRCLAFIHEYARWCATAGEDTANLADALRQMAKVRQQPLAPKGLTRPELRRFLKEADLRGSKRDRALVHLLLYTGLRLGELERLRLEDLSLSSRLGLVKVRSESAKGGKERTVPVPALARASLSQYLSDRGDVAGPVFYGERGALGRNGITKVVAKYARAANLKMSPHTLRHCFAYGYLEQSANDLVGLAAILGHSNLNTTMGYTRKRLEDLQRAVEDLDFA